MGRLFSPYLFRLCDNIWWVENQNINFSNNMRHNAFDLQNKVVNNNDDRQIFKIIYDSTYMDKFFYVSRLE